MSNHNDELHHEILFNKEHDYVQIHISNRFSNSFNQDQNSHKKKEIKKWNKIKSNQNPKNRLKSSSFDLSGGWC